MSEIKSIATEYQKKKDVRNNLFVELLNNIIDHNKQHFENSLQSDDTNKEGTALQSLMALTAG